MIRLLSRKGLLKFTFANTLLQYIQYIKHIQCQNQKVTVMWNSLLSEISEADLKGAGAEDAVVEVTIMRHIFPWKQIMKLQQLHKIITWYEIYINEWRQRTLNVRPSFPSPMSSTDQLLCRKFSKWIPYARAAGGHNIACIFMWLSFVLIWNLMSLGLLDVWTYQDDCILIQEQGHKGDQTGNICT